MTNPVFLLFRVQTAEPKTICCGLILTALLILLTPPPKSYSQTVPPSPAADSPEAFCQELSTQASLLCVTLKVVKGKFAVDDNADKILFYPNETLKAGYKPTLTDNQNLLRLKKILAKKIQAELDANAKPLCEWLKPTDKNLCFSDSSWQEARKNFANAPLIKVKLENTLKQNDISPLTLAALEGSFPVADKTATIRFEVDNPIDDICDAAKYHFNIVKIGSTAPIADEREICRSLKPLNGRFWEQNQINNSVTEFYAKKGLMPVLSLEANEAQKILTIYESPAVKKIFITLDDDASVKHNRSAILKIFYNLLPSPLWKKFDYQTSIMKDDLGQSFYAFPDDQAPYFNIYDFQLQQLRLAALNYQLTETQCDFSTDNRGFICLVASVAKKNTKTGKNEEKAVPIANPEGVIDTNQFEPERQTKPVPKSKILREKKSNPAESDEIEDNSEDEQPSGGYYYFGGGFNYRFGDKPRLFGIVQRHFSSGADVSLELGGEKELFGNLNFFKDYLFFSQLKRRLSLQLTGKSDFTGTRRFNGVETTERRSGGLIRAEIDLLNNWHRSFLRLSGEFQKVTVQLGREDRVIEKSNLNTAATALSFISLSNPMKKYPQWSKIEARLRFGLGLSNNEPKFTSIAVSGKYHRRLPGLFEFDGSGKFVINSRQTPLFEQASFGGGEVLRGFRTDELIGRRLWSLQPELWIPFFGIKSSTQNAVGKLLRDNLRTAVFFDVGGIYKTGNNFSGVKSGPGIGLRFVKNPITFKLDYAYGLGETPLGGRRGKFYFGIETNLPF